MGSAPEGPFLPPCMASLLADRDGAKVSAELEKLNYPNGVEAHRDAVIAGDLEV